MITQAWNRIMNALEWCGDLIAVVFGEDYRWTFAVICAAMVFVVIGAVVWLVTKAIM